MLCKNCGKELPIAGKFCPFCGAAVEQEGANDETAVFTSLPDELKGPIDVSAFDAAMQDAHHEAGAPDSPSAAADPLAATDPHIPTADQLPPIDVPPVQRASGAAPSPRTTYFGAPDPDDRPYRKPSKGKKAAVIVVIVLVLAALIGGGVWYFLSSQPDENQTRAERYMESGDFDKALDAYLAAQAESGDPSAFADTIQLLQDFQATDDYLADGDYAGAVAWLRQLQNRVTDTSSTLYAAIGDKIAEVQSAQSDSEFSSDLQSAQDALSSGQLDSCLAKLDDLDADDTLSAEQKQQVSDLRDQLTEAQASQQKQEENEQKQSEQKQAFSDRMDALEQDDLQISSAATTEDELALTASSFEQWDGLLAEMYDYLSTILNADQYASEEASYQQWIEERDSGAANAANGVSDQTEADLASYSFRQSYTKTRCYRLLDLM